MSNEFSVAKISIYSLLRKLQSCLFFYSGANLGFVFGIHFPATATRFKTVDTVLRAQTIAASGLLRKALSFWNHSFSKCKKLFCLFYSKLRIIQTLVETIFVSQKFEVTSLLDNQTFVHYNNFISIYNSCQSMSNYNGSSSFSDGFGCSLDQFL